MFFCHYAIRFAEKVTARSTLFPARDFCGVGQSMRVRAVGWCDMVEIYSKREIMPCVVVFLDFAENAEKFGDFCEKWSKNSAFAENFGVDLLKSGCEKRDLSKNCYFCVVQ